MSKKFVRSTKDVTDIEKFSKNLLEENDIVSTQDGKVYVVSKNGFVELGGSFDDTSLKQEITNLKSENTKLKKRATTLETDYQTLETNYQTLSDSVTTLETNYQTLSDRVTALETPTPTE